MVPVSSISSLVLRAKCVGMVSAVFKNFSGNAVVPGCFIDPETLHSELNLMEGGHLLKVWYDGDLRWDQ